MNTKAEDLPVIEAVMAGIHAANQMGHQMPYLAYWVHWDGLLPQLHPSLLLASCGRGDCMATVCVLPHPSQPQFVDDSTFLYPCRGA